MPDLNNFGDVFPPRNLGGATPWGRHVETRIVGVEQEVIGSAQRVQNENRVTSARADLLAGQMGTLSEQQKELEQQQDALLVQQGALEAQQQALELQQESLQVVINSIPITEAYSGDAVNFSVPLGTRSQISISVPVPEGKTKASILAMGQAMWVANGTSQAGVASWRTSIGGFAGSFGNVVPLNMDGKSTSFSQTVSLSVGLISSFTIEAQSDAQENNGSAPGFNRAELHAIVTFSN